MKHIHHIIPKHMGGTDDPSNLVELTPKQHALAHKKLYEKYGKWQDWTAWQGLSGRLGKEELFREIARQANIGKKHNKQHRLLNSLARKKFFDNVENREHMRTKMKGNKNRLGKTFTKEQRQKISNSLKGNSNKLGKTGYKMTEENKKKLSNRLKGDNNPAKRPEVREKLRQAALRRYSK